MKKLHLIIENNSKVRLPGNLKMEKWLRKTAKLLQTKAIFKKLKEEEEGRIELYFVDSLAIKKLNKKYRDKNKVTDVLSFSFLEGDKFPGEDLVGEIFIDPITAKKQAENHGMKWEEELEFLFVHALLHVFGYDHENEKDFRLMFGLQAQIMPDRKWGRFVEQIYRESFGEQAV